MLDGRPTRVRCSRVGLAHPGVGSDLSFCSGPGSDSGLGRGPSGDPTAYHRVSDVPRNSRFPDSVRRNQKEMTWVDHSPHQHPSTGVGEGLRSRCRKDGLVSTRWTVVHSVRVHRGWAGGGWSRQQRRRVPVRCTARTGRARSGRNLLQVCSLKVEDP